MLQLYIVYRLLLYRRHWGVTVALMVLCIVLQLCLPPESEALNRYRYNFMGGMLPFGMGLLAARYERYVLSWRGPGSQVQWDACLFVVSLVLVYLMSLGFVTWTFVPVMVCASCIGLVKLLTDAASSRLSAPALGVWSGWAALARHFCVPSHYPQDIHSHQQARGYLHGASALCHCQPLFGVGFHAADETYS